MLKFDERKLLYAFLAELFSYPEQSLLASLDQGLAAAAAKILAAPDFPLPPVTADQLLELQTAYTELFINCLGGVPAAPYGSVYLDEEGQLFGESTLAVAEAYRQAGLVMEGATEPPDFLPTEMEFLYFLVDREERAVLAQDAELQKLAAERQEKFLRDFLLSWVPEFCRRLSQVEQGHPLYLWGSDLLMSCCDLERSRVSGTGQKDFG